MLNSWVAQGLISHSTAMALAGQFDTTAAAADKLGDTDPTVKVSETGNKTTQAKLGATRDAAFQIPTKRTTALSATDHASNIIRNVRDLLFGIPKLRTTTMNVVTVYSQINAGARPTGRQHGGPVRAGEVYTVGEDGPEFFVPDRPGQIMPSTKTFGHAVAAGGTGSGAMTVRLEITGTGGLAKLIHEEVRAGRIQLSANGQRVKAG
jgi:hypothetical protein